MRKVILFLVAVGAIVFIAYQSLIFYDNNFRYGRMRETPAVKEHEKPLLIMEEGLVPVRGGEAPLRAAKDDKLLPPHSLNDPGVVQAGKTGYFIFCAQCHGPNHDGNGTVGQSFHPLPTDLRSSEVQSKTDGAIFKSISYGVPGTRQPPLATTISIDDRWRIVAYLKSLGTRK
jgi:mono/diheme cytochrome c family protein